MSRKKYALSIEDVCIKLLTVAENDPALAPKSSLLLSWQFKAWP
jgi:hypothetical protein